jgi:PKD repeat protein
VAIQCLVAGAFLIPAIGVTASSAAAASTLAADTFTRTVTAGWGSAEMGGRWSLSGTAADFSVAAGTGRIVVAASALRGAYLPAVSSTDVDSTVDVSLDSAPTNTAAYVSSVVRHIGTSDYRVRVKLAPGTAQLQLNRTMNGTVTTLAAQNLTGVSYTARSVIHLRIQALGSGTATIAGKVWFDATPQPAGWMLQTTDSTAGLQAAGGVGVEAYMSANYTPTPVTVFVDNLVATAGSANAAPTAAFGSSVNKLSVSFTNSSTDSDGTIASQSWNFGDGSPVSTVANPTHGYASAGTYQVTLTVTDNGGATNSVSHGVTTVANVAPTASFTSTPNNLVVSFVSTSADPDGSLTGFSWDFGDGSAISTAANPSHTYASAGTYQVSLTVTDNDGATNSITQGVTVVASVGPVASFTSTVTKLAVSFASTSTDSSGTIIGYSWDFGDGSAISTAANPSHTYASAGTYQVSLTVTDDAAATNSVTQGVTVVANVAPTASFTSTTMKLAVSFVSTSTDSDGTITGYSWDFGDGSEISTAANPSHTYPSAGTFQVTLTVTDNDGSTTPVTQGVAVVANQPPSVSFTASVSALTVGFNASASVDPDGTITSYSWDFGDESLESPGVTTTHTYATGGTFQVTLTLTDNDGATSSITQAVQPVTFVQLASDSFTRTMSNAFGAAPIGGTWSLSGTPANFSVNGSVGRMVVAAGALRGAYLPTVSSTDVDSTVDISLSSAPTAGTGYLTTVVRRIGTSDYRLRLRVDPGATALQLIRDVSGTLTTLASKSLGTGYSSGSVVHLRLQALGTGTTSLNGKVWFDAQSQPSSWTLQATDITAALQAAGGVGVEGYTTATFTPTPVTVAVDNLNVTSGGAVATPLTAAFTSSANKLAVAFTNTSTDTAGTIVGQTWDFGDGSPTSNATNPSHTYAIAGSYQVTLTVTDSNNLTAHVTQPVYVANVLAPPGVCGSGTTPPATYNHIVVIMEENRRWSDVGGVGFGSMPYLHSLATQCSTFADWTETDTTQSSLTQYVGLTSGVDNPAVWNDCSPSLTCRSTDDNIFRQVRSGGGTPRSFVEGATTGCSAANNADRHVPALYYYGGNDHDFCNVEVRPLTELDVNNLPTFAMITPNLCNDGHDCPNSSVDAWDSTMINSIVGGANYQSGDTAVFVMYDEDYPVPNLLIAPTASSGVLSTAGAGHAAMLKTWEQMLGLPVMNQGQLPTAISLRGPANL